MKTLLSWVTFYVMALGGLAAQQVADTAFQLTIGTPRYPTNGGSFVMIDAAHHNFHTAEGRYAPFAKVLRQDGYQVVTNTAVFTNSSLQAGKILVISNPLDSSDVGQWRLPNPSAFSEAEVSAVNRWVKNGGRLLLIADHMPFAGAAESLARSFGFEFSNCFASDNRGRAVERFYKQNGTLSDNEITQGIDTIVTFTGSAFKLPENAKPILVLKNYTLLMPEIAWQFEESTHFESSEGYFQGAYMPYGKGRVVVMGEAAMFSAQLSGPNRTPVGMNSPVAAENGRLLLNILHWLDQ